MKKNLLPCYFALFAFLLTPAVFAASKQAPVFENPVEMSSKNSRQAKRMEIRLDRLKKKFQKKMERLQRKGKAVNRINLGAMLGLVILLTGGLFIVLGLVIPAIGIVFLVIGIIIAFVGLLVWLLLGGISVDVT